MSSTNRIFKRAFARYDHNYQPTRSGLHKFKREVEDLYRLALLEQLAAKPKPKKWRNRKPEADEKPDTAAYHEILHYGKYGIALTAAEEKALRAKFLPQVQWVTDAQNAMAASIIKARKTMAATVEGVEVAPGGPETLVCVSSAYNFSTQTQPAFYAENFFRPLKVKLEELGCKTRVAVEPIAPGLKSSTYNLYADIPRYMAQAVDMRISDAERCKLWKQVAANPLVYNPFLPYELASF